MRKNSILAFLTLSLATVLFSCNSLKIGRDSPNKAPVGYLPPHTFPESPQPTPAEKTGLAFSLGTNLWRIEDYSRETPFVNLMRTARVWYTKKVGSYDWNSEKADQLAYRKDGYPTHSPQTLSGQGDHMPATLWADITSWPLGNYTVLWDGIGTLTFGGNVTLVQITSSNRMTFELTPGTGNWAPTLEMVITSSSASDPVHNIRILMPGTESTYLKQPFYGPWLEGLRIFKSLRFMDWAQVNSWNYLQRASLDATQGTSARFTWDDRSQMDHYTWADGRGVPYEIMIQLLNQEGFDGWICVPERVDEHYITQMAKLFLDTLDPSIHLTVEFSNETWNTIMAQTLWLKDHGTPSPYAVARYNANPSKLQYDPRTTWPEKTTGPIEKCLQIWTEVYGANVNRLTRVVGLQAGWFDVSQRLAFNIDPQYFDALTVGWYFALHATGDEALDQWGSRATEEAVAQWTRYARHIHDKNWMRKIKMDIAIPMGKPLVYYEGGQHVTPTPFGAVPSYKKALESIHRSPIMKDLYLEWLAFMRTLADPGETLVLYNYSYIAPLSAQYGSWGIWEEQGQDTSELPAPKWEAYVEASTW